jgi:hypothetical protein
MEFYFLSWQTDSPASTEDDRIPMPVETYSFIHNNAGYVLHMYPELLDYKFEMDTPASIIKNAQKMPYRELMKDDHQDARQLMIMGILGNDGEAYPNG